MFFVFQSVGGRLVKNMSAAHENVLQNPPLLSPHDLNQQQISFPSLSTYICDITEDDQLSKQLSKCVVESEDTKSTLRSFR